MKPIQALFCLVPVVSFAGLAQAQVVEGFESGNPDVWQMEFDGTFNGFSVPAIAGTHSSTGGNPGGRLSWTQIQSPVNVWHLNNKLSPQWKGNFRARGIGSASMDMTYVGNSPFGMHMYVVLADDMGTAEITDDILIWTPFDPATYGFAGFGAALGQSTWHSLDWDIPSSSTTLPAGWTVWSHTGTNSGNDDADWNSVIQDVDYLAFVNGAPWGGSTLGMIDISFDNLGLNTGIIGTPFCACDGSGTAAPCGNTGTAGTGCNNSQGAGGTSITASGGISVAVGDLVLTSEGAPPGVFGVFFQGQSQANGGLGVSFGDGLLCAGGAIKRLEVVAVNGAGTAISTVNIPVVGLVPAGGATNSYQFWYRDPMGGPCGAGYNTSNGLEILWLP
jgi:hypothetical protein